MDSDSALFREDSKQKSAPTQLDNSFTPCKSAAMTLSGTSMVLGGASMLSLVYPRYVVYP